MVYKYYSDKINIFKFRLVFMNKIKILYILFLFIITFEF